jgi:hypothetical protein
MEFVHPERLWFLFLLLIPIAIHLFHFRKRKTFYFSSLRFIQFLEKEQQSTRKLKHLLVLISRLLAVSAIVFAFAQPQSNTGGSKKNGKNAVLIYLDNSFSMSAIGTEGTLFSEGRELAKRIITKLQPDTRVLVCSNLLQNEEQRFVSKAAALSYIDQLELYALPRSLNTIFDWQQQSIKQHQIQHEKLGQIQQIFISDFQKSQAQLQAQSPTNNQSFYAYQLKAQQNQNAYIDSIWFAKPTHQKQTEQTLQVRIRYFGEVKQKRQELKVEIGKINRTVFVEPKENQSTVVSFPYTETNTGFVTGMAQLNDAQIHFDDTWFFSYEVPQKTNIYIIEESGSSPAVSKAFAVEPRYVINRVTTSEVNASTLQDCDLIVLNGLNEISSGLTDELLAAQQSGQRILVIPGENIATNDYRPLLDGLGLPTLTAPQNQQLSLQEINDNDPFFVGVFEKKQERLNVQMLKKAYVVNNQKQTSATPLLLLRSGQALFMRANTNAFLWTAALQPSFGSIINQALFPTILLRCAEFAGKRFAPYAVLGQDVQMKIRAQYQQEAPLILKSAQTEFIVQHLSKPNQINIQLAGSAALEKLKAGHYDLRSTEVLAKLALNYNRSESALAMLDQAQLLTRFEDNGIKNCTFNEVKNGQSLQAVQLDSTTAYWRLLLFFGLLFLLAELALLKWWK